MSKINNNIIHAKNMIYEYDAWVRRVDSLEKAKSKESYIDLHKKEKEKLFEEIVRLLKIGLDNE